MIIGAVTDERVVLVTLPVAKKKWRAIVDTGFNGDLELPEALKKHLHAKYRGPVRSLLAGGVEIEEIMYTVDFPFDGSIVLAYATLVPGIEILLGTGLLRNYHLEIDFPARTVKLERVSPPT